MALAATPVDTRDVGGDGVALTTHLPPQPDDDEPLPPLPRRRWLPLVIAALVVGIGAFGVVLAIDSGSSGDNRRVAAGRDAGVADARTVIVQVEIDAAMPVQLPADAGVADAPADAGRRTIHADAAVVTRPPPHADAAVVATAPDAAEPQISGSGLVNLIPPSGKGYLQVSIDAAPGIALPKYNFAIRAGKHVIQFLDPRDGQIEYSETIVVGNGETVTVRAH
jgi:hypothetical protein